MLEITNGTFKVKIQYNKRVTAITCIMKTAKLPSDIDLCPFFYRKFMGQWYVVQQINLPNVYLGKMIADELEFSWKAQFQPPEELKGNDIHNKVSVWMRNCIAEYKQLEYGKGKSAESQNTVRED